MARQTIRIDPIEFANVVGAALARGAEGGLDRTGSVLEREMQSRAPVATTSLRSSITSQKTGCGLGTKVSVGPNVKSKDGASYDNFQEFGTGLFSESPRSGWKSVKLKETGAIVGKKYVGRSLIRPRKKRALAFTPKGGGGVVVRKWVRGVKPKRYVRDGFNAVNIEAEFVKGFNAVRR